MMRKKSLIICVIVLIVCLAMRNFYLIYDSTKPNYKILIGNYVNADLIYGGNVVKNKEDAQLIEVALMRSTSIDKPEVSNRLPDARISISDWKVGIAYIIMDVWFDEEKVVFNLETDSQTNNMYKEAVGFWGESIKEIIYKYQSIK